MEEGSNIQEMNAKRRAIYRDYVKTMEEMERFSQNLRNNRIPVTPEEDFEGKEPLK